MDSHTVLPYDQQLFDDFTDRAPYPAGPRTSHTMRGDPRHLLFSLSRYKFCAKMLEGKDRVLEIGCSDAFGAPIVLQAVKKLHCVDIEPQVIEYNTRYNEWGGRLTFSCTDVARRKPEGIYDAAFCMDVIEHIEPVLEASFLKNIVDCLIPEAVCIFGTPNIAADAHASAMSRAGHINLKSQKTLRTSLEPYFKHIFMFSMNDEVVHTGYAPMAHFLIALCVDKRR